MRSPLVIVALLVALAGCRRASPRADAPPVSGFALVPMTGATELDRRIAAAQSRARARPDDPRAWVSLARLFVLKARTTVDPSWYAQARDANDRALAAHPDDVYALETQGALLLQDHRFADAEALGRRLTERFPRGATGYCILADAQLERGEYRDALQTIQTAMDLRPDPAAYVRAGRLRWITGDADGAVELHRAAANAGNARDAEAWAWNTAELGRLYLLRGDLPHALEQFDLALTRLPGYPRALAGRGQVLAAMERWDDAITALRAAVAATPDVETLWVLGDALRHAGRGAEADAVYADLARQGPRTDPRTFALYLATRNQDLPTARQLIEREHEVRDDLYTADVHAWVLYRLGEIDRALTLIERAARVGVRDARVLFHLGAIRRAAGQRERSNDALRAALAANPYFDRDLAAEARRWLAEGDAGAR